MGEQTKNLKRYIRDLMAYDESLILDGRDNAIQDNEDRNLIVVDLLSAKTIGKLRKYDKDNEAMSDAKIKQARYTIDFYGLDALANAEQFDVLIMSEAGVQLQNTYSVAVFNPTTITNVRQLTGKQQMNRYQLEVEVRYNIESTTTVKRIDTAETDLYINY